MVFNAIFNNMSVISWRSVLLVEETRVPGESHRPVGSHWQTLSHNVVSSTPQLRWIRTHVSGDRHWYYIGSMDMNPETNLRNPECMFRTCTSVIILASFLFLIYHINFICLILNLSVYTCTVAFLSVLWFTLHCLVIINIFMIYSIKKVWRFRSRKLTKNIQCNHRRLCRVKNMLAMYIKCVVKNMLAMDLKF